MHRLFGFSLLNYLNFALTFAFQIIAARLLGPEIYGAYIAAYVITGAIEGTMVSRGMDHAINVLATQHRLDGERAFGAVAARLFFSEIKLFLAVYIAAAISLYAAAPALGINGFAAVILMLCLPLLSGHSAFKARFQVAGRMRLLAGTELAFTLVNLGMGAALILAFGFWGLVVTTVVGAALKSLMLFSAYHVAARPRMDATVTIPAYRFGWVPMLRNITLQAFTNLDLVLLNLILGPASVGQFKVAKSLAAIPMRLVGPIWRYYAPQIISLTRGGDHAALTRFVLKRSALVAAIGSVVVLTFALLGERAIALVYGTNYAPSYLPAVLLSVGSVTFFGVCGWFRLWSVTHRNKYIGLAVYAAGVAAIAGAFLSGYVGNLWQAGAVLAIVNIALAVAAFSLLFRHNISQDI